MFATEIRQTDSKEAPNNESDVSEFLRFRVPGDFSTKKRSSLKCICVGLGPDGLHLKSSIRPEVGEAVDSIFEQVGRLNGTVQQLTADGFIIALPLAILSGLWRQISWLLTEETHRRHLRIQPRDGRTSIRINSEKTTQAVQILDFSLSGASLQTEARLQIDDKITFANLTLARVVREADSNVYGVEFQRSFRPSEFSWNTKL